MPPLRLSAVVASTLVLAATAAHAETPKAVATIAMIADVARNVGGECVTVETLMGAGVDPHLYQASASDVQTFQEADAILYSGYSLEGQLGEVLSALADQKPTVAVSTSSIDPGELITVQDIYGIDPHLWMDASLWAQTAPTIARTFAEIAPDCAATIEADAKAYKAELEALHSWIGDSVASIPEQQRVLVTAHDAFAYYGRAYGIDVQGIQGISTEAEAGIGDIRAVVDQVIELNVPAVFIESTINPRTIQAVIDGAAARDHEVAIGGELYSDAMGAPGTVDGTYIGMMRSNTLTIVNALGGETAPWPDTLTPWAEAWSLDTTN